MSSSMQLAQECLEKNEEEEAAAASANASGMEGLEKFAQTIDNSKIYRFEVFFSVLAYQVFCSFESHQGEVYQHGSATRISPERL